MEAHPARDSVDNTHHTDMLRTAIERMTIDPLKKFGVVEAEYKLNEKYGWKDIHSFRITPLGRGMLEVLKINHPEHPA